MMRIWKLTPIDPSLPVWKGYDTSPIFVRAESAAQAQDLAQLATAQVAEPQLGLMEGNPWVGYRTRCEDVTDISGYSVDGPAEVLNRHKQ
jgi:hypothetical protein